MAATVTIFGCTKNLHEKDFHERGDAVILAAGEEEVTAKLRVPRKAVSVDQEPPCAPPPLAEAAGESASEKGDDKRPLLVGVRHPKGAHQKE